ncbi:hypothetical protein DEAC_c24920 [Desulfosporosinus acididurans]|uniref:Uncharacterized protein n=1 Tax=Desulfosporosinus acididurans TaxID=476652 RepID=A0A0J1FPD1_9FIRM|nr:hypothetical protein [Desulfosporosinus acididurans]KLU65355.1 hypothetical protein DEAC_c24920 [Desulfosporosinus acididurans]
MEDIEGIGEPDKTVSDRLAIDSYFVTVNESGRLKKIWTWIAITSFLIGTSMSIISFLQKIR